MSSSQWGNYTIILDFANMSKHNLKFLESQMSTPNFISEDDRTPDLSEKSHNFLISYRGIEPRNLITSIHIPPDIDIKEFQKELIRCLNIFNQYMADVNPKKAPTYYLKIKQLLNLVSKIDHESAEVLKILIKDFSPIEEALISCFV